MSDIKDVLTAHNEVEKIDELAMALDIFASSGLCLPTVIYDKAIDLRNELIRYSEHISWKEQAMIYEFGRSLIHYCKCIKHFFRAMFCKSVVYDSHGFRCCKEHPCHWVAFCQCYEICEYWNCPKVKGAEDGTRWKMSLRQAWETKHRVLLRWQTTDLLLRMGRPTEWWTHRCL